MNFKTFFVVSFILLAGCGGKADQVGLEKLRQGDRMGALTELEADKAKHPDARSTHYQLFVLYRYLQDQGEPAKSEQYQKAALDEYLWITQTDGVTADFKDMEGTLKAAPKSQAEFSAAYANVYGR